MTVYVVEKTTMTRFDGDEVTILYAGVERETAIKIAKNESRNIRTVIDIQVWEDGEQTYENVEYLL